MSRATVGRDGEPERDPTPETPVAVLLWQAPARRCLASGTAIEHRPQGSPSDLALCTAGGRETIPRRAVAHWPHSP